MFPGGGLSLRLGVLDHPSLAVDRPHQNDRSPRLAIRSQGKRGRSRAPGKEFVNGTGFALTVPMNGRLKRFDVFLALVTVGGVAGWGDPSTRLADVSFLLTFWAVYFTAAMGLWLFNGRRLQPAPVKP